MGLTSAPVHLARRCTTEGLAPRTRVMPCSCRASWAGRSTVPRTSSTSGVGISAARRSTAFTRTSRTCQSWQQTLISSAGHRNCRQDRGCEGGGGRREGDKRGDLQGKKQARTMHAWTNHPVKRKKSHDSTLVLAPGLEPEGNSCRVLPTRICSTCAFNRCATTQLMPVIGEFVSQVLVKKEQGCQKSIRSLLLAVIQRRGLWHAGKGQHASG
jgi:hypothetical protein